ncbi:MAG: DivIVA domain-containing protein, partial [Acutalibacteraceae bacterium]|nr:DivIVA domain-containing protein [Acutalibacteraceae bacterium]
MMTPAELREYEFKGAGRNAYKSDDVDNFFGEVAVAYEKIFRENAELVKRVSLLADRLEQFKQDEEQIKQAVIGAQKAADIIVKEAEMSIEDSKAEAEAILAAAKGEADIIKSDAEKQAIADSDLLLSIARDKAEEIINKAKEEAHGILIEANDSAKDTVGAATRTITSESLHYEMLKKEVSEFRASILSQYKAHIELISKLPELAVEEAAKQEDVTEDVAVEETIVDEISSVDPENDIIEFIEADEEVDSEIDCNQEFSTGEDVIKTTLPYDFFEENSTLEFVEEAEDNTEEAVVVDETPEIDFVAPVEEDIADETLDEISSEDTVEESEVQEETEAEDIPISQGFSVNPMNIT